MMEQLRILVADDNEDHRFFISRALAGIEGIEIVVTTVADGDAALAYLRREPPNDGAPRPHLLLLDLRMPRRSGLEVLEELRGDDELRSIPVCVLTSSDRPDDIQSAYEHGTNAYVVKSSNINALRERVLEVYRFYTATAALPVPPP